MEERITVQLTKQTLYDFLLYHTYSKFSGFLTNVLGVAVGIMGILLLVAGKITWLHLLVYLIASFLFIAYTPFMLTRRAKRQMEVNPEFRDQREYIFSEKGILIIQNMNKKWYDWENIHKSVVTPKNIGIYWGKDQAFIIPKEAFGDRFVPVMQMIAGHIGTYNVRLR